jgi:hypothetical protein
MTGEREKQIQVLSGLFRRNVETAVDAKPTVVADGGDRHGALQWIAQWEDGDYERFIEWDVLLPDEGDSTGFLMSSEVWAAASHGTTSIRRLVGMTGLARLVPEGYKTEERLSVLFRRAVSVARSIEEPAATA